MPGSEQDPLNYLKRQLESSALLPHIKAHLATMIKRAKREPFTDANLEKRMSQHQALFTYAQILRLQEQVDSLDATTLAYKNAIFALCKLTENYRRNLARVTVAKGPASRQSGLKAPPVRGTE